MNDSPVGWKKNALTIVLKAIYLLELARQVLEWRITAPNNKVKCVPENNLSLSHNLFSHLIGDDYRYTDRIEQTQFAYPKVRMTWTGTKVDLVELIYALEAEGCFNHGNVKINEIAAYIEVVFNIDLGDYYGTFKELRNRVSRTAFLDRLIKVLKDRMNKVDRKK